MQNLHNLNFLNEFVNAFPGDASGNLFPRQTPGFLYSKAVPTPVKNPNIIACSEEMANELGLSLPMKQKDIELLAGNLLAPTMYPFAACYAGHQFGQWAGQLGDGRAITLGELKTPGNKIFELQLKGAGPTPYSRRADGRAVLRSSVREFLVSEAMFHLGVPTTRALSLVTTGEMVMRDMFYDGNAAFEPGAIVMRVSPSFLRFGNFEILAAREEIENLRNLVNWTISRYFPHLTGEDKIIRWFSQVVEQTANMVVEWLRVGFVHGVMNTDNMSILGLTIDYGPFSFLDDYDQDFTPNTTDLPGRRYAFGKQASVAHWNLSCLASAIAPLFKDIGKLKEVLESYEDLFYQKYYFMMGNKLGLDQVRAEDKNLILRVEEVLSALKPDMTIFYQLLIDLPVAVENEADILSHFKDSFYQTPETVNRSALFDLIKTYSKRITSNHCTREFSKEKMMENNPRFILRNYLLHQAIEELERGDDSLFLQLHEASKQPYSKKFDEFFNKRPDWASGKAGCSMLSCSS